MGVAVAIVCIIITKNGVLRILCILGRIFHLVVADAFISSAGLSC